jgi:hypothetical protein
MTLYLERSTNLGSTSVVAPSTVEVSFETDALPLSCILTGSELSRARVLKIDVEGAEASVVWGLAPVLGRLRSDAELVIEVTPRLLASQGMAVSDVVRPLEAQGFKVYELANHFTPRDYPAALHDPGVPARWSRVVRERSELVFSRVDAERLP